jgi:Polyketide cyclase / dehydrase and lipid transport
VLELAMSVELGSPAETVWSVVGNFNGLPDWHPWVKTSVLDPLPGGVGRRVTIEGAVGDRRELHERLVSHDYSRREYAYAIIAGPTPRRDYVGRLRAAQGCGTVRGRVPRAVPGRLEALRKAE